MENNNTPIESTNTNPLFMPRGYWGKGASIEMAQLAKAEFEGVEMYPEQPPVSAAELKEILRELAPRAAVAANDCEMSPIEIDVYSKWGDISKETVVNAPPLLVHFAFVALSFLEAEAEQPVPSLVCGATLSSAGAPGGFNVEPEAIMPQTWTEAAQALNGCLKLAESGVNGQQIEWVTMLDDARGTFSHLRKGLGAMLWMLKEYREASAERLGELREDLEGIAIISGAAVPETVATEVAPDGLGDPNDDDPAADSVDDTEVDDFSEEEEHDLVAETVRIEGLKADLLTVCESSIPESNEQHQSLRSCAITLFPCAFNITVEGREEPEERRRTIFEGMSVDEVRVSLAALRVIRESHAELEGQLNSYIERSASKFKALENAQKMRKRA